MGRTNIRKQANALLVLSGAGILAAFPFQHTFGGGLLFAISALFGNPLRIKWPTWLGTHIIARNRERLIGELADMVEKELLTVDTIRETLEELNLAEVIIRYLTEHDGSEQTKDLATRLAADMLGSVNAEELAKAVQSFIRDRSGSVRVADLIADIAEWSVKNGYDDRVLTFFAGQFARLAGTPQFGMVIEKFASAAIRSYEGDKFRRRLVDFTAGLSAQAISVKVQAWIVAFLKELGQEAHPHREALRGKIAELVVRLREDDELRRKVEAGKEKLLATAGDKLKLDEFLAARLESLRMKLLQGTEEDGGRGSLPFEWMRGQMDKAIHRLATDVELRSSLDGMLKRSLMSWISQKHAMIGVLVREKLGSFSESDLIELVRDKAGKDLQYIRLNGMIVGSFVGILLYFATFWIGGGRL
jgi:uncharacterized membrane-anchored protein YjiN (DUF445 family)